jgi:hypothetical protein
MIRGDDVPRRPLAAGCAQDILEGLHVIVPESTFLEIVRRELPLFPWVFEAFEKSFALFVLGQVEEELENDRAVVGEMMLKPVDIGIALGPEIIVDSGTRNALGCDQFGVDLYHENFLVVGTIENTNAAALGDCAGISPEEVMAELFGRGVLEAGDLATLRIEARHDMFDGAVLTCGIHCLKNDEDRPLIGGVEAVLDCGKCGDVLRKHIFGESFAFCFGEPGIAIPAGVIILEVDGFVVRNTPEIDDFFSSCHGHIQDLRKGGSEGGRIGWFAECEGATQESISLVWDLQRRVELVAPTLAADNHFITIETRSSQVSC